MFSTLGKLRGSLAVCLLFAGIAFSQSNPPEAGVPVTDPLVIEKCGGCHARDERGNMQRISWARTTPEGWQDALKRMILGKGVPVTPAEARSIVKYLSTSHGLAAEEARPLLYDTERRIHEETNLPGGRLNSVCTKCHSFARALSWRRSAEEWKQFADSHAARYKIPVEETVAILARAAPLHTPEWDAWSARPHTATVAGRWLVTASLSGHGTYYGEMEVTPAADDGFNTRVILKSVRDASTLIRTGRSVVYGGYAWRGRSQGVAGPASSAPDDLATDAREVLWIAPDQATATGRWFWGQYQEFGFDVKLQRISLDPTLVAVDRVAIKIDSQNQRIRVIGRDFPTDVAPAELNLGAGVTVRRIVAHTSSEIIAEVDVAADAAPGTHDVTFRRSVLPGAFAVYDRVDYLKVTPESSVASFGDATHARGYQQFEAIGYQRGPDGKAHTADDVELGPMDVTWSLEVFYVAEGKSTDFVGKVSPTGLLTPSSTSPGNNFDVWAVATAKNEKDSDGKPLVGKGYVVVTVPAYTFAGHQYVRDLDKWVDNGPIAADAVKGGKGDQ